MQVCLDGDQAIVDAEAFEEQQDYGHDPVEEYEVAGSAPDLELCLVGGELFECGDVGLAEDDDGGECE